MKSSRESELLSKYLPTFAAIISIFVSTKFGPDPVNMPKLTLLTIFAMFIFGLSASNYISIISRDKTLAWLMSWYLIGLIISLVAGKSNLLINFYGGMARNTGFLTYIMLFIFSLGIYLSSEMRIIKNLVLALFATGIINLVYGSHFLITGKDIIDWNNRYDKFLGTVGNPDFASALMGLAFACCLAIIGYEEFNKRIRYLAGLALLPIIVITKSTGALQGLVIIGLVTFIFASYRIWLKFQTQIVGFILIASGIFVGIIAILGTLQLGPLQNFLYKQSVTIRGAYWRAALKMFESSPIFGIGLDSYGENYRKFRDSRAVQVPGLEVVTDSAHNVFLDILASGGLILFIPYLALIIVITYRAYRLIFVRKFESNLTLGLFLIWVAYIAQSAISINQIGLAIWGWVFGGAILLVDKLSTLKSPVSDIKIKKSNSKDLTPGKFISVVVSTLIGVSLVLPVQLSDTTWVNALRSRSVEKLMAAADKWPRTCGKFLLTYNTFSGTKYVLEAKSVLEKCLSVEPENFNANYLLTQFATSDTEKADLKEKLHLLDPLNPNFK